MVGVYINTMKTNFLFKLLFPTSAFFKLTVFSALRKLVVGRNQNFKSKVVFVLIYTTTVV